jgi:hypothetical protein
MRRLSLSPGRVNLLIRAAVVLTIIGLLMLIPILLTISGFAVGLFMLGSLLITTSIALYVVGVIHELRERQML